MPSDDREARSATAETGELERLEVTLRQHKEHFDSLIAAHEQQDRGGGFLASLAGALHGFVEVVETGLFGDDDPPAGAGVTRKPDRGIRQTVAALQAGVSTDSTDADRADTLTHLRQVSSGIQERLDHLARQIAARGAQVEKADASAPNVVTGARARPDDRASAPPVHRREAEAVPQRDAKGAATPVVGAHDRAEPAAVVVAPHAVVDPPSQRIDIPGGVPPIVLAESVSQVDELVPVMPLFVEDVAALDDSEDSDEADDVDSDDADDADDSDDSVDSEDSNPSFDPNEQVEIGELAGEAYDVDELLRSGTTVADLHAKDIPAAVLTASGVSTHDLLGGGYTVSDLHEANVDVAALRAEGVTVPALKDAGFTLEELRGAASVSELRDVASASEMRDAGFGAGELRDAYALYELVPLFTVHELHDAGYRVDDLRHTVPFSELRSAFDLTELSASFSAHELRDAGLSASEVLQGGHSLSSLKEAGYGYHDLMGAGASPADLRHLYPEEAFYESTGAPSYLDEAP